MTTEMTHIRLDLPDSRGDKVRGFYELACRITPERGPIMQNFKSWPAAYFDAVSWVRHGCGSLTYPGIYHEKPCAENDFRVVATLTYHHEPRGTSVLRFLQSETRWNVEADLLDVWWEEFPAEVEALKALMAPVRSEGP